jgi:hypothetical protein
MSLATEIIRAREARGPVSGKARFKRAQESFTAKEPELVKERLEMTPKELVVEPAEPAKGEGVKVKILRVCANPRLVLCVCSEDEGVERRILVRVGRNRNFVRGMELKAIRPAKASEPWLYQGRLPRLRGRW